MSEEKNIRCTPQDFDELDANPAWLAINQYIQGAITKENGIAFDFDRPVQQRLDAIAKIAGMKKVLHDAHNAIREGARFDARKDGKDADPFAELTETIQGDN